MHLTTRIKNKIISCDRDPATPELTYQRVSSKQNLMGGICGIIFVIFGIFLFVTKAVTLFKNSEMTLKTYIQRDMSQIQIHSLDVAFYLSQRVGQKYIDVSYKDYAKFGVDVYVYETFYNYTANVHYNYFHDLTPCTNNDSSVLCAKKLLYKPICNINEIDHQICPIVREYDIIVLPCDPDDDPLCSPVIADGLLPMLFLIDNKFNVSKINKQQMIEQSFITVNSAPWKLYLDKSKRILFQVPVTKLVIQTDQTMWTDLQIFKQINKTQSFFYRKQTILPLSRSKFSNVLMDFNLVRSPYTQNYYRSFYKIDYMLIQIFCLLAWFSIILTCICKRYNKYQMRKYMIISKDQSEKQEYQNKGFINFVKQGICVKQKQLEKQQIDILQMHKNLAKAMQIIGIEKFAKVQSSNSNQQRIIYTNQPLSNNKKKLVESQQQIKKGLLQSQSANLTQNSVKNSQNS